jgi:hypothetical protein
MGRKGILEKGEGFKEIKQRENIGSKCIPMLINNSYS